MIKRNKTELIIALCLLLIVAAIIGSNASITGNIIADDTKSPITAINTESTISPATCIDKKTYAMAIGEESTITATFTAAGSPAKNVTLKMTLPDALEHISGSRQFTGALEANGTATLKVHVSAVKTGAWHITTSTTQYRDNQAFKNETTINICISVTRKDAEKICAKV